MTRAEEYRRVADAAWRWVLDQVHWDDGLWIPETDGMPEKADYRDGMSSGIGGLALVLAELRRTRAWTTEEQELADAVAARVRQGVPDGADCTYFDGLVSDIGVLGALGADGVEQAVDRLLALHTPDGWPQTLTTEQPRYLPGARLNDVTLGTAGVLLGALWARRMGVAGADDLGTRAAAVLLAEAERLPTGLNWLFVPRRFHAEPAAQLPNFSHGVAGVATALALAGAELDRPDLRAAARDGAEHLVTLADTAGGGFAVPHRIPGGPDEEKFAYGWCHGTSGTSLLFLALDRAGVGEVAGAAPLAWHRRCLHSIRESGLPARLRPGFWDNDGRCCGTAGVGEVFLNSWQRSGDGGDLDFALFLADTLVERAVLDGPHAYWRFIEHRAAEPLLAPGVGWMQGAGGIAAFLWHAARVADGGPDAVAVGRMDTWWSLPPAADTDRGAS